LFIIDDTSVDEDGIDVDVVYDPAVVAAVLAALWILNPKIKDDVPIKKETIARIFPVRPGMIAIGAPWFVCCCLYFCCCCCCCCAFAILLLSILMPRNDRDNSTTVDVNSTLNRPGNNVILISNKLDSNI
jgi:hypothetical protein